VFIGMESIDPANLKDVNKGFNKPGEYAAVLERLAQRNVYAITSFIFGMDNDTTGVAERTLTQVRTWPPGLPIFGLLTPLPSTPLYQRLETSGRLTRPKHWQEFIPFAMAHTPLKMTIEEAHAEVRYGWEQAYSPEALAQAVESLDDQPLGYRINIFLARLCFRGIYFPMMGKMAWLKVVAQNRRTIFKLAREAFFGRRAGPTSPKAQDTYKDIVPDVPRRSERLRPVARQAEHKLRVVRPIHQDRLCETPAQSDGSAATTVASEAGTRPKDRGRWLEEGSLKRSPFPLTSVPPDGQKTIR
jgi:hypothetical protein